jgi:putative ABC transport system permease protein
VTLRELWFRLIYPLRQRRIARELREEMDLHVALRARRLLERGDLDDARAAARAASKQFGNATRIEDAARDAWGWRWLDGLSQDLRYVARQLVHSPVFALVTMTTIAIGIALNATAFTFYDAIVLKPLPVRDPHGVVRIVQDARIVAADELPYTAYDVLRRESRTITSVVVTTSPQTFAATMPGRSREESTIINARFVSPDFATALGVGPFVGRWFGAGEDAVAVLDYRFWSRALNADPSVIGRRLTVHDRTFTIVGIGDQRFVGTGLPAAAPDIWLPIAALASVTGSDWRFDGRAHWQLLGRLAPGASLSQLRAELETLRAGIPDSVGRPMPLLAKRATFFQADGGEFEVFQQVSAAFMVALALILSIAVVNLINLFAARNAGREREIAVRLALGASRGRIARQLASESLLLAGCGGALGLLASRDLSAWLRNWSLATMSSISGGLVNVFLDLTIDWRVAAYTAVLSIVIGLAVGVWPALRSARGDANTVLRAGGTSTATAAAWGGRNVLLGVQIAACTILLAASGLLLAGMRRAPLIDPRFDAEHQLVVFMNDGSQPAERRASIRAELQRRLAALPMVRVVAWTKRVPLDGSETRTFTSSSGRINVSVNHIGTSYFDAMGVRLARGRMFTADEVRSNAAVMLVSQALVRVRWPGQDPIGKTVLPKGVASGPDSTATYTVIGVVPDVRSDYLSRENGPTVYFPYAFDGDYGAFVLRTRGAPASAINAVRLAINGISPTASADTHVMTMVGGPMALQRLMAQAPATVALVLAVAGLALAAIGIYGVISSIITRRTREIGVRIALGARPSQVALYVVQRTLRPVAIGATFGMAGAIGVSVLLRSMIAMPDAPDLTFGAGAFSPLVLFGVIGALAVVVLLACVMPARRASMVEPVVSLRSE